MSAIKQYDFAEIAQAATGHDVLVVDDNKPVTALLRQMLTADGHCVRIAHDGETALETVADNPPDLILLDLELPDLSGYEVCGRIKRDPVTRLIPILIITGQSSFDTKLRAWEFG